MLALWPSIMPANFRGWKHGQRSRSWLGRGWRIRWQRGRLVMGRWWISSRGIWKFGKNRQPPPRRCKRWHFKSGIGLVKSQKVGESGIEVGKGCAKDDEVGEIDVCAGIEGFAKVVKNDSQDCKIRLPSRPPRVSSSAAATTAAATPAGRRARRGPSSTAAALAGLAAGGNGTAAGTATTRPKATCRTF